MYLCYMDESGDTGVRCRSLLRFQGKSGGVLTYAVVVDKSKRANPDNGRDRAWRFAFQRIARTN